jgi:hypothetical protein
MKIDIDVSPGKVLGGAECRPFLKLSLTEEGAAMLETGELRSADSGLCMDEWLLRTLIWRACDCQDSVELPDLGAIEAMAARAAPLLDRVHAGHSIQWDGADYIGHLDADAAEAAEALDQLVHGVAWAADAEAASKTMPSKSRYGVSAAFAIAALAKA